MSDFYAIYLLFAAALSISLLPTHLCLIKEQEYKKEISMHAVALAFMLVCMPILQNQEVEIYKEHFLAGNRLNCDGFALSQDLGYVLEEEYLLQTSTNKLVSINTCTLIGDVFIYTQPLALGLLVLYTLFFIARYLLNRNKNKDIKQQQEQE